MTKNGLRSIEIIDDAGRREPLTFDEEVYAVGGSSNLEFDTEGTITVHADATPPGISGDYWGTRGFQSSGVMDCKGFDGPVFIASNGGLTAGRVSPDKSLFPLDRLVGIGHPAYRQWRRLVTGRCQFCF